MHRGAQAAAALLRSPEDRRLRAGGRLEPQVAGQLCRCRDAESDHAALPSRAHSQASALPLSAPGVRNSTCISADTTCARSPSAARARAALASGVGVSSTWLGLGLELGLGLGLGLGLEPG